MAKKPTRLVQLINEEVPTKTKYVKSRPISGVKAAEKLRLKKYDPIVRRHCWFVEKRMPNPKAK